MEAVSAEQHQSQRREHPQQQQQQPAVPSMCMPLYAWEVGLAVRHSGSSAPAAEPFSCIVLAARHSLRHHLINVCNNKSDRCV